jgi:hypothetical protein
VQLAKHTLLRDSDKILPSMKHCVALALLPLHTCSAVPQLKDEAPRISAFDPCDSLMPVNYLSAVAATCKRVATCGAFPQKESAKFSNSMLLHENAYGAIFERHAHHPDILTFVYETSKLSRAVYKDVTNCPAAAFVKINTDHRTVCYNARGNAECAVRGEINASGAADHLSSKSVNNGAFTNANASDASFKNAANE